jgi:CRISPR/Cas system-associated endonuclease Cas1
MSVVSDIAQIVNNTNMSVNERLIELTACKNVLIVYFPNYRFFVRLLMKVLLTLTH